MYACALNLHTVFEAATNLNILVPYSLCVACTTLLLNLFCVWVIAVAPSNLCPRLNTYKHDALGVGLFGVKDTAALRLFGNACTISTACATTADEGKQTRRT